MGYRRAADSTKQLQRSAAIRRRDQFPVTRELIYLNHAAVAPLCLPAARAMEELARDARDWGSFHYPEWQAAYEGLRRSAARLIGATRDEIAIVKNTSEGIATVALGLDWQPGATMVAFEDEFPANQYPWRRLEGRGVRIRWLRFTDPLERIEEAAKGARLLAISFVQYLSGWRADLEAIGAICRRHGCFFFVDAIQGLGTFPLDVRRAGIHGLAADGHKWLLGPEGCGVLFVDRDWLEAIEPVEFGWTNAASYPDYASRDMALRPDAGRYECGTLNTIGCFGLRAAVDFLLETGVETVETLVLEVADRLAQGARAKGYEVLLRDHAAHRSGIVTIRKPGTDSAAVCHRLREHRIVAAPRQGWVRLSPHFYITPEEIDRTVELLP
jgi:cysteine desulfurase / selenocysteine lyase